MNKQRNSEASDRDNSSSGSSDESSSNLDLNHDEYSDGENMQNQFQNDQQIEIIANENEISVIHGDDSRYINMRPSEISRIDNSQIGISELIPTLPMQKVLKSSLQDDKDDDPVQIDNDIIHDGQDMNDKQSAFTVPLQNKPINSATKINKNNKTQQIGSLTNFKKQAISNDEDSDSMRDKYMHEKNSQSSQKKKNGFNNGLLWQLIKRPEIYNQDGVKKNMTEFNEIFSDAANTEQMTLPTYLEIPDPKKFQKMSDQDSIDHLIEIIDMKRDKLEIIETANEKKPSKQVLRYRQQTSVMKETTLIDQHERKIGGGDPGADHMCGCVTIDNGEAIQSFEQAIKYVEAHQGKEKIEKLMLDQIQQLNSKFINVSAYQDVGLSNLPQFKRLMHGKCDYCKKQNGLNSIQIIKYDQKHFIINKYFLHNSKGDSKSNKFEFQIMKYQHGYNINKGTDNANPIGDPKTFTINDNVTLQCADPSLVQLYQNGGDLYYFQIKNSSKRDRDEIHFMKYDLIAGGKPSVVREYSLDPHYEDFQMNGRRQRAFPVSVLISQKNKLFDRKKFFNNTVTPETIQNMLVILIYNLEDNEMKPQNNQIIFSIRTIKQFDTELQQLAIPMKNNSKIYRPQVLTKQYIKQQKMNLKRNENLLIITYYDQDKHIEYNKILQLNMKKGNQANLKSPEGGEERSKRPTGKLLSDGENANEIEDKEAQIVGIEDKHYPLNLDEIDWNEEMDTPSEETVYMLKIIEFISKQQISKLNNSSYCKSSADYQNKEYFEMQINPYIQNNINILLHDCLCQNKKQYFDHTKEVSKMFIFIDYIIQKIIIMYNKIDISTNKDKELRKNWYVFELNVLTDRMRYDEVLQNNFHIATDNKIQYDDELPVNRLFQSENVADNMTLTLSYEFKNMIRDQNTVYIFMHEQLAQSNSKQKKIKEIKKISDKCQYFKELTGPITIVSKDLNKACSENKILSGNENDTKNTNTFIYQSEDFKEQKMYQITDNKFHHVHLNRKESEQDNLLEFCEIPFVLQETEREKKENLKQTYTYKYIGESLIFKEDDRQERPIVIIQLKEGKVNNIWFTVINFKQNQLLKSQLVHFSRVCLRKIEGIRDVKLCPSSSLDYMREERSLTKNQTIFFQNYQLIIFFRDLNRFKFLEYEVQWSRSGGLQRSDSVFSSEKSYTVDFNLVGMKEFLGMNQWTTQKVQYHLMPLLDDTYTIQGTQIYILVDGNEKKIFPIPNKDDKQYMCHNRLTKSSYQEFNVGFDCEYILFDVKLSIAVLIQINFFGEYEKEQLLSSQLRILSNMVPYNFVKQLERKSVLDKDILTMYDWFQCLEILNGQCINEFQLEEPQLIQNYLECEDKLSVQQEKNLIKNEPWQYAYSSCLDYLLKDDIDDTRINYFNQTIFKRMRNEVINDFFQMSIIEKCMQPGKEKLNVTGDIIMRHMYKQYEEKGENPRYQILLMKMVSQATNVGQESQFLRFINDEPEKDFYHTNATSEDEILHIRDKLHDKNLPFLSDDSLRIEEESLSHIPLLRLNDLICTRINSNTQSQTQLQDQKNDKGNTTTSQYPIEHYTVDFRNHIFQKRLNQFRQKSFEELTTKKVNHDIYTQKELSDDILLFLEKSQGQIENQQVIRHIVDHQFTLTKRFYMFVLFIYMVTCYIPLVIQIFSTHPSCIFICNILMPIGTIPMVINESIQILDQKFEYFLDPWNMNDFTMILGVWVYSVLSIFNESLQEQTNFLVIRKMEFIDQHLEDEIIIDLLSNIDNSTFRENYYSETSQNNMNEDWLENDSFGVFFMSLFNILLLLLGTIKLLFYLRIFESFSNQISLIGFCLIDMIPFMGFFIGSVIVFSILFRVCGLEIFLDDYVGLSTQSAYLVYAYRNSIGDLNAPVYNFWLSQEKNNPQFSWFMIKMIWFFWFINQFINLIILLNFLIALIGETYSTITNESIIHAYNHRAALNQECRLLFHQMQIFVPAIDFLIVHHEIEEKKGQQQQWSNHLNQIKDFVYKSLEKVKVQQDKNDSQQDLIFQQLEEHKKKLQHVEGKMTGKIDVIEDKMQNTIKNVHAQMESKINNVTHAVNEFKTQMGDDVDTIKGMIQSLSARR